MQRARRVWSYQACGLKARLTNSYSNTIQAQARFGRNNDTYRWLQRRDCDVQEYKVQCVGRRWTGQDPTAVEALLLWHTGSNIRDRQQGHRSHGGGRKGARKDNTGCGNEACVAAGVCQQAGPCWR